MEAASALPPVEAPAVAAGRARAVNERLLITSGFVTNFEGGTTTPVMPGASALRSPAAEEVVPDDVARAQELGLRRRAGAAAVGAFFDVAVCVERVREPGRPDRPQLRARRAAAGALRAAAPAARSAAPGRRPAAPAATTARALVSRSASFRPWESSFARELLRRPSRELLRERAHLGHVASRTRRASSCALAGADPEDERDDDGDRERDQPDEPRERHRPGRRRHRRAARPAASAAAATLDPPRPACSLGARLLVEEVELDVVVVAAHRSLLAACRSRQPVLRVRGRAETATRKVRSGRQRSFRMRDCARSGWRRRCRRRPDGGPYAAGALAQAS